MIHPLMLAALILSGVSMAGVTVNELSHGGVAEMMGLGHRHMLDHGGYHCVPHDHGEHGAMHMQHMHEEHEMSHGQCAGGTGMHGHGGMGGRH